MSFAPPKGKRKLSPGNSPTRTQDKRNGNLESPVYASGMGFKTRTTVEPDISSRLDVIESNLSRVSQQQDALLPLMSMLDFNAALTKNETMLKSLHKKSIENDDKISKIEQSLKNFQTTMEQAISKLANQKPPSIDLSIIDKNFRGIMNQINDQGGALKDLENNFMNFQKLIDSRFKEENLANQKVTDSKLEKNKQDINMNLVELKTNTQNSMKKLEDMFKELSIKTDKMNDFVMVNSRQKIIEEINGILNMKLNEHSDFIREKYDKDLDNICREVGIVRSEINLINEEKRQIKMNQLIQSLPKDIQPAEKKIKMNNIEQTLNIFELDKFNKDNTQIIIYELQAFDDKLENLRNQVVNAKIKTRANEKVLTGISFMNSEEMNKLRDDMDLVYERYINLKYQIEGAKKKYLFDMRKIEDKMDKILQIKREAAEEMISNPKTKRIIQQEIVVIDGFPEKIKNLMEAINMNLETTFTRLEIVEEKIRENQDLLKMYTLNVQIQKLIVKEFLIAKNEPAKNAFFKASSILYIKRTLKDRSQRENKRRKK